MIAAIVQLVVFVGSAWLLSRAVDWCYRRNEPPRPPPEPALRSPSRPDAPTPAPASAPAPAPAGSRS
jgi:hypothetical protein